MLRLTRFLTLLALALLVALLPRVDAASADEGWVVRSFGATYVVNKDASLDVVEVISVDFGEQDKHGIFRDIPVEYAYDAGHKRRITVKVGGVDDTQRNVKYDTSREGANLRIKIGDPDKTVSGAQLYRIHYRVTGAINPQDAWDELYWNVTGNGWPVGIEQASATLTAPSIQNVTCYEGPLRSTRPCNSQPQGTTVRFATTAALSEGGGLTIVAGLTKGSLNVPPLDLVEIKSTSEQIRDFIGLSPLPIALAVLTGVFAFGGLGRYWWLAGRDRWFGDVHYLTGDSRERRRPLFARDTIVVEYQPPEIEATKRRLRPAEVGTLVDERADTLDVSATIVDLAVRGYLRIVEVPKTWLFGKVDYSLEKRKDADEALLPYETLLLSSLFDDGDKVTMSELRNKFYEDLSKVKTSLYEQVDKADGFFPRSPESVRTLHRVAGAVIVAAGVVAVVGLGSLGAAIVGLPIVLTGLVLLLVAGAMPRRTAAGREMFRRCLGFREYMVVAETDRQRFNEEEGIFQAYLPFAMVFDCVERWAHAFEGLEGQPAAATGDWYVASHAFAPLAFAQSMQTFSTSIGSAIASTPGGSGGSGFSGGFSGGGVGGGGGGSW